MNFLTKLLKNKKMKYGSLSLVLIAVVVAIAIFINLIIGTFEIKFDLTPTKFYSIGDTTKEILENLDKPIKILGIFDEEKINEILGTQGITDDDYRHLMELLRQYEKNEYIDVEFIDPDKNPSIFKELDPDGLMDIGKSDIIVIGENKKRVLTFYDLFPRELDQNTFTYYIVGSQAEQKFSGAIKYVTTEITPVIYFLTGHDEGTISRNYTTIASWYENNNYEVKEINLLTEEKVPEDADTIIISSPKRDISRVEFQKIRDYFEGGGNGVFLFDSLDTNEDFEVFKELLLTYNIDIGLDKIEENDQTRLYADTKFIFAPLIQNNSINGVLNNDNYATIAVNARSIKILKNTKEWIKASSLLKTSNQAQAILSSSQSESGPFDIAAAVEYTGGYEPVKILVYGSSSFIDDTIGLDSQLENMNKNYFLTTFLWTQDESDNIYIPVKKEQTPTIQLNRASATAISIGLVVVLPLIIMGIGLIVFIRRRHL